MSLWSNDICNPGALGLVPMKSLIGCASLYMCSQKVGPLTLGAKGDISCVPYHKNRKRNSYVLTVEHKGIYFIEFKIYSLCSSG